MKGSIKEDKNGKFSFVFDAGKDPLTGKRKQIKRRGFSSRREAHNAMVQLKAELLNDDFVDISSMTYGAFMDEYFKERRVMLQKTTVDCETILYKNVISKRLDYFKLQQIKPIHIQKIMNDIVSETDYSPKTVQLIFSIVNTSLNKAKKLKLIKENPATGTRLPKITKREMSVWTTDQVNEFINESRTLKKVTRCRIGYVIGVLTGMRCGEILGLTWSCIDFNNGIIHVKQTLTQDGRLKSGAKNESSVRSIYIPSILEVELLTHRDRIVSEKQKLGDKYNDYDLVLCTREGKPIIPRNFRTFFHETIKRIGLPKIRLHDLRHTHVTMLLEQPNINIKLISERIGHSSIQMTLDVYGHVLPSMAKSVSDELEKIIVTKSVTTSKTK